VRDTLWESRRHREVKLASRVARYRLFTNPDGLRKVYEFAGDDWRGISEHEMTSAPTTSSNVMFCARRPVPLGLRAPVHDFGYSGSHRPIRTGHCMEARLQEASGGNNTGHLYTRVPRRNSVYAELC
jgi:hypothetical protein